MADETLTLSLDSGDVVIKLRPDLAPNHVARIKELAGEGFYDGVKFHRVIPGFMAQGGCPNGIGNGGPGYRFEEECSPKARHNKSGMLSMANAGPGTNGSQFFITVADTSWLWGKHTVFGEVADEVSRKVVDKIAALATDGRDKPLDDVIIESVTIEKA